MNNTYLLESEINDIKAIRANYINDEELTKLSKFLDKHKRKISIDNQTNRNNVWSIIYNNFNANVLYNANDELLRNKVITCPYADQVNKIIIDTLPKYSPEMIGYRELASKLDFSGLKAKVYQYLYEHLDKYIDIEFDYHNYILDSDFDLSIYGAKSLNKELDTNTTAICNAYHMFFDSVTKSLTPEQKQIVKDNFIDSLTIYLRNSTDTMSKDKDSNYRIMSDFINNNK